MTCEIECPKCGHVQEYDDDNDTILCDKCDEMIFIEEIAIDIDGWLSPDGKMIECKYTEHTDSAEDIIENYYNSHYKERYDYLHQPDDILCNLGWIKKCSSKNIMLGYGWFPGNMDKITQAQYNYIYSYCIKRKCIFPRWWRNIQIEN